MFMFEPKFKKYLVELNSFHSKILCKFRCRNNYLPITSSGFYSLTDEELQCTFYVERMQLVMKCIIYLNVHILKMKGINLSTKSFWVDMEFNFFSKFNEFQFHKCTQANRHVCWNYCVKFKDRAHPFKFFIFKKFSCFVVLVIFLVIVQSSELHQPRLWFITGGYLVKH